MPAWLEESALKVEVVSAARFKLPKELLYVLIVLLALFLQYSATIWGVTMRARIQIYKRTFMRQFDELHKKHFPEMSKVTELGYPDTGNGFYSKKLPYSDWFKMNNAQRCQINFLEHMTYASLLPVFVYFTYPRAALVIAIMIFFGRLIFTMSYSTGGPSARLPGALIMDAALIIGFGYMVSSTLALAK